MNDDLFSRLASIDFPIERGVPITADRSDNVRTKWDPTKFPFAAMAIGDSFVARPPAGEELIFTQNAVSGAASSFARRYAKEAPDAARRTFTTRQQGGRFVRCWRTA